MGRRERAVLDMRANGEEAEEDKSERGEGLEVRGAKKGTSLNGWKRSRKVVGEQFKAKSCSEVYKSVAGAKDRAVVSPPCMNHASAKGVRSSSIEQASMREQTAL